MEKRHLIIDITGVLITSDRWGNLKTNKELITYLISKKDQYAFTLLTNNPAEIQNHMESVYGIPRFYGHFISAGQYELSKSDPKLYEEVMAKLQATPEQCIFVDDTPANLKAAASLGITGILYKTFDDFKTELERETK